MSRPYDLNEYDWHMCLKVGAGRWVVIRYLMRPFLMILAARGMGRMAASPAAAGPVQHILYPDSISLWVGILTTFPVILFNSAWSRRSPGAIAGVQTLWKNSARLLASASHLNIAAVFVPLVRGVSTEIPVIGRVQVGIVAAIMVYLFVSRRVRDTCADFPAAAGAG